MKYEGTNAPIYSTTYSVDFGQPLTMEMLEDAFRKIEEASKMFSKEGYRYLLKAWQWKKWFNWQSPKKNDPNVLSFAQEDAIPDNAMVSMAENGPMFVNGEEWKGDENGS